MATMNAFKTAAASIRCMRTESYTQLIPIVSITEPSRIEKTKDIQKGYH